VQSDEDAEQRNQRHGEPDDQPGDPVGEQDASGDDGGYHRGDEQGGQVAAEVALQAVQAAGRQGGQLGAGRQVRASGSESKGVLHEPGPQLADHVGGRAVCRDLTAPGQDRAPAEDDEQAGQ
jgi:hypothetical protein